MQTPPQKPDHNLCSNGLFSQDSAFDHRFSLFRPCLQPRTNRETSMCFSDPHRERSPASSQLLPASPDPLLPVRVVPGQTFCHWKPFPLLHMQVTRLNRLLWPTWAEGTEQCTAPSTWGWSPPTWQVQRARDCWISCVCIWRVGFHPEASVWVSFDCLMN